MIGSVIKALNILECFSPQKGVYSLQELSEKLGYPKTTIHTILKTLEYKGYVGNDGSGCYFLGTAPISMTQSIRVNLQLRDRAAPLLRELGDYSHSSVYLAIPDSFSCLYIYAIESAQRLIARTAVGDRALMHYTSVGKAMLAYMTDEDVDRIIAEKGLPAATAGTITNPEELKTILEKIRETGISDDNAEHEEGIYCLGAPIFNETGRIVGACSISGGNKSLIMENRGEYSACIRYTAQEISRRLGFFPSGNKLIWKENCNPLIK